MHNSDHLCCLDGIPVEEGSPRALSLWTGSVQMPQLKPYEAGDVRHALSPALRPQPHARAPGGL